MSKHTSAGPPAGGPRKRLVLSIAVLALVFVVPLMGAFAGLRNSAVFAQAAAEVQGPADKPLQNAWVIPAGKDEVLGQMLGGADALPGSCTFADGQALRTSVRATYKCPSGDVVFELQHPSKAPAGATQTARFAIKLQSGSPPEGFTDALVARIRAHETGFEWTWIGSSSAKGGGLWSRSGLALLGGAVMLGGLALLLIRRRGRGTTTTA